MGHPVSIYTRCSVFHWATRSFWDQLCCFSLLSLSLSFFLSFSLSIHLPHYLFIHPSLFASLSFYQPAYISLFSFIRLSVRFDDQLYAPIIEVIVTACSCRRRTPQMKLYGVIIVGARPLDLYDPVIHSNREPASEPDVRIGFFFLSWNCKKDSRGSSPQEWMVNCTLSGSNGYWYNFNCLSRSGRSFKFLLRIDVVVCAINEIL